MRLVFSTMVFLMGICVADQAVAAGADFAGAGAAFLKEHCLDCHSGEQPKAGLSLEGFKDSESVVLGGETFEKVLRMITTGEMPPVTRARPSVAEAEAFVEHVEAVWDYADRNRRPDPGRVTMRRLNRTEYRNTIRDLIGVDFDARLVFPSDDIGHGFDNIGDVLSMSPVLMERYLDAAEQIMSEAITPDPPAVTKRRVSSRSTKPGERRALRSLIVDGFRPMRTDGESSMEVGPIQTAYKWMPGGEYIYRGRVYAESGTGEPLKVTVLVYGEDLADPTPEAELDKLLGMGPRPARILETFFVTASDPNEVETLEVRVGPMANR